MCGINVAAHGGPGAGRALRVPRPAPGHAAQGLPRGDQAHLLDVWSQAQRGAAAAGHRRVGHHRQDQRRRALAQHGASPQRDRALPHAGPARVPRQGLWPRHRQLPPHDRRRERSSRRSPQAHDPRVQARARSPLLRAVRLQAHHRADGQRRHGPGPRVARARPHGLPGHVVGSARMCVGLSVFFKNSQLLRPC